KSVSSREFPEESHKLNRDNQTNTATESNQERTFDKRLCQKVAVRRTQCLSQPNLFGSLGDRYEHDVDDTDCPQRQGHDAYHPQEPVHRVKDFAYANRFLDRVPILKGILGLRVKAMAVTKDLVHLALGREMLFLGQ